jgi:ATP-dependent RNA helicase TDRD9
MSALPIPPHSARLILLGHVFGVLKECTIIAAALTVKSPFSTPFKKQLASYMSKLDWANKSQSDCFAILHAYKVSAWDLAELINQLS